MTQFQFTRFNYLPPVVKNLLILNGLVFLATAAFPGLDMKLGMYFPTAPDFQPYQIVTHMFTHGSIGHIFFNMFSLWMFGAVLENVWGPKRFLQFYLIAGFGAAALHLAVNAWQLYDVVGTLNPDVILTETQISGNYSPAQLSKIASCYEPIVGASGAIYGLLVAFGMLFPNTLLYIYFIMPVKAKYIVIIMIALDLYSVYINSPTDNIAHFAHLGGALMGFIMIKVWSRNSRRFY